jgi:hypothetical protein
MQIRCTAAYQFLIDKTIRFDDDLGRLEESTVDRSGTSDKNAQESQYL